VKADLIKGIVYAVQGNLASGETLSAIAAAKPRAGRSPVTEKGANPTGEVQVAGAGATLSSETPAMESVLQNVTEFVQAMLGVTGMFFDAKVAVERLGDTVNAIESALSMAQKMPGLNELSQLVSKEAGKETLISISEAGDVKVLSQEEAAKVSLGSDRKIAMLLKRVAPGENSGTGQHLCERLS